MLAATLTIALAACGGSSGSKAPSPPTGRYDLDKGTLVPFTADEQAVVNSGVEAEAKLPKDLAKAIGMKFVFEDMEPLCEFVVLATYAPSKTHHFPNAQDGLVMDYIFGEGVRFGQVAEFSNACSTELADYFAAFKR